MAAIYNKKKAERKWKRKHWWKDIIYTVGLRPSHKLPYPVHQRFLSQNLMLIHQLIFHSAHPLHPDHRPTL